MIDEKGMENMTEFMSKMMEGGGPMGKGGPMGEGGPMGKGGPMGEGGPMGKGGPMGSGTGMPMMDMMSKMMPQGLAMMLPRLPKEQRLELAKELVATIVQAGVEDLNKEERNKFFDDLVVTIRPEEDSKK